MRKQPTTAKHLATAAKSQLLALACFLVASAVFAQTSAAGTATAAFVASDTTTLGNWQGVYGADGYVVANNSELLPSYAGFGVQPQQSWTWAPASSTVDPRALQTGNNTGKIAAAWYNQVNFYLDVNLTDANTHQVAVYFLDWDYQGRSETVQIVDPTTNKQLDSRTISGFTDGIYLIWTISGHVHINITTLSGPNSVVSGIFFATNGANVNPATINLSAGKTQQFTASVVSSTNQQVTWSIAPSVGTISTSGLYTAPATISAARIITVTATSAANTAKSGSAMVDLVPGPAIANFVSFDTTTQGNWSSVYGADGYSLANANQVLPSYDPSLTVQNQLDWVWASSTTDPRALKIPGGSGSIAATWYNSYSFSFDVNLADGNSHQVAFYALDWDNLNRSETIQIQDATTNAILDTETVTKFTSGVYAIWSITGHVKVTVTDTAQPNSVISGVFFGGSSSISSTSSASNSSSSTNKVVTSSLTSTPPLSSKSSTTTSSSSSTALPTSASTGTTTSGSSGTTTGASTGTITHAPSGTTKSGSTATASTGSTTSASSSSTTNAPTGSTTASTATASGQLSANATSVSFGSVNIGSSSSQTVSVSNTGTANVTISNDSISGAGLNAGGASGIILSPGQSTTLNVTFTPASAGSVAGSLTIASNASNSSLSIALSGTGVQPPQTTYSVVLTWSASTSAGVVGYYVFRGTVDGGPYTELTPTPLTGTSYTDTTAQAGQNYYYAVTSVNSSNVQSGYSNVVVAVVP